MAEDDEDALASLIDEQQGRGAPIEISLGRLAHGTRNIHSSFAEIGLHHEATDRHEVCIPGVDFVTAVAMGSGHTTLLSNGKPVVHSAKFENYYVGVHEQVTDSHHWSRREWKKFRYEVGYTVFMHESWQHLHHVVRYFDLIEKNEAPDTSLLEWLACCGAVRPEVIRQTVQEFSSPVGEDFVVLCEADRARLLVAADVAESAVKQPG